MKRDILSRYERDAEGNIVLDITATRVEDLYNNFDKSAPYIRRDLDQDLADYLIGCVREISRVPFSIRSREKETYGAVASAGQSMQRRHD